MHKVFANTENPKAKCVLDIYRSLFPPWNKKITKGICDYLPQNSDFFLVIASLHLAVMTFFFL